MPVVIQAKYTNMICRYEKGIPLQAPKTSAKVQDTTETTPLITSQNLSFLKWSNELNL